MAFCQKCGAELAEGAAFCASCGTAVGTAGTGRKQEYTGVVKKCPNCGEVIPNGLATKCPSCGFELNKTEVGKGIKEFTDELKRLGEDFEKQINFINSYVVPSNKEDIVEFLSFANAQSQAIVNKTERTGYLSPQEEKLLDIWNSKCEQTISKGSVLFSSDSGFMAYLDEQKKQIIPKIKKVKSILTKSKAKDTATVAVPLVAGAAVVLFVLLFILNFFTGMFTKVPENVNIPATQVILTGNLAPFFHLSEEGLYIEPTGDYSYWPDASIIAKFTLVCDKNMQDAIQEAITRELNQRKWRIEDCRISPEYKLKVVLNEQFWDTSLSMSTLINVTESQNIVLSYPLHVQYERYIRGRRKRFIRDAMKTKQWTIEIEEHGYSRITNDKRNDYTYFHIGQ